MASLSLEEETPEQVVERMTRELAHVSEQSRVSHRMAIYWRGQYDRAEKLRIRMEKSLETWRKKLLGMPKDQRHVTEATLALWAAEANTEANTRDEYGPV